MCDFFMSDIMMYLIYRNLGYCEVKDVVCGTAVCDMLCVLLDSVLICFERHHDTIAGLGLFILN